MEQDVRRPAGPRPATTLGSETLAFTIHLLAVAGLLYTMMSLVGQSERLAPLLKEDGAFEWLTAAFLLLACGLSHLLASSLRRIGHAKRAASFWIAAFLFFVAGMEEFSWGQRILGFGTPDALVTINRQKEFTLHNLRGFQGTNEIRMFLVTSAYGALSGVILALLRMRASPSSRLRARCESVRLFTVPARFAPYFLPMLAYVILHRQDAEILRQYPETYLFRELFEFVFVFGCYLTVLFHLRTAFWSPPRP